MKPARTTPRCGEAGFSIVELAVSMAISAILFCAFTLSLTNGIALTASTTGDADLYDIGRRTLEKIQSDLMTTGRFNDATLGIIVPAVSSNGSADAHVPTCLVHDQAALAARAATYPAPVAGVIGTPRPFVAPGSELAPFGIREIAFRRPADVDGDGRITSSTTGNIEWGPEVFAYIMVPNTQGSLNLVRRVVTGNTPVDDIICRCVDALTFDTTDTKHILPLQAVEIHLHLTRQDARGVVRKVHLSTTVAMRN